MATDDPRYVPVAAALPEELPPITRHEAERASRLLTKKFGKVKLGSPAQLFDVRPPKVRRCWISPKPTRGHWKGWGRLIHDVSHIIFAKRHPNARPHDGGHATLEREIAQDVVAFGWLEGKLKPTSLESVPVDVRRAMLIARKEASLARWEKKHRRAENAMKKLRRQIKSLQKKQETN